jgi:hypothetical protein
MDHEEKSPPSPRKIAPVPAIIGLYIFLSLILVSRANAQSSADHSGLRLVGTVMAGGFTGAVLGDAKGEQTFYRLHETLPDGSQIIKVQRNHILIRRSDGVLTEMYISHAPNAAVLQTGPPLVAAPPPPAAAHPAAQAISPAGDPDLSGSPLKRRYRRPSREED